MERATAEFDTIFLNGTVGAGKSTIADAISHDERLHHAVVDLDHLRRLIPAPVDDPFNHELELKNLAAVATQYREAGARRFVLAGVIERRDDVPRYAAALQSAGVFVCRLTATPAELQRRLRQRHADDDAGFRWHLARSHELENVLDAEGLEHFALDTTGISPVTIAATVREAAGWTSAAPGESTVPMSVGTWQVIDGTLDNVRAVAIIDDPGTAARASAIREQGWKQVAGRSADGALLDWPDGDETTSVVLRDEQWAFVERSLREAAPIYRLIGNVDAEAAVFRALAAIKVF